MAEDDVAQPAEGEAFHLGTPVLVCRWRLHDRTVPLLNRHVRALAARRIGGKALSRGLLSWAKQHVEWSLADDTTVPVPDDGVLMLVVDEDGQAAMSTGAYEPLADVSCEALAQRAIGSVREADETGVAPEVLACVEHGVLTLGVGGEAPLCGVASLADQLVRTRGGTVARDPALPFRVLAGMTGAAAPVLLLSDEHGVVVADGFVEPDGGTSAPGDVGATSAAASMPSGAAQTTDEASAAPSDAGGAAATPSDADGAAAAPSDADIELVMLLRDGYQKLLGL